MIAEVHITLCDALNEAIGYQIRIVDTQGAVVLFTSRNPATGTELFTYADAIQVAAMYVTKKSAPTTTLALTCDMERTCTSPVTHIDVKGWVYCATHGPERRQHGTRCRKLTPTEIQQLRAGQPIAYQRKNPR